MVSYFRTCRNFSWKNYRWCEYHALGTRQKLCQTSSGLRKFLTGLRGQRQFALSWCYFFLFHHNLSSLFIYAGFFFLASHARRTEFGRGATQMTLSVQPHIHQLYFIDHNILFHGKLQLSQRDFYLCVELCQIIPLNINKGMSSNWSRLKLL